MKRSATAAIAAALLATTSLLAAETEKSGDASRQAVEKLVASLASAFNHGDAKALAELWTPAGELVGFDGQRIEGRGPIEKRFAEFFAAKKKLKLALSVVSVRLLGDAAVVDAVAEITPPLRDMPAEPRSTLVLLRRDGRWLIDSARDTLVYDPSNYRHLKAIEWMVGDWSDETATAAEAARFHSTCAWTTGKNFLIRKYNVGGTGPLAVTGTEVIGWDPRRHCIRSWNFDSNGGYGESTWRRDGDRWIVRHSGVLQDGSEHSAVHVMAQVDDDTVTLKSQERTLSGQRQPDAKELRIHRLPRGGVEKPAAEEKPAPKTSLP